MLHSSKGCSLRRNKQVELTERKTLESVEVKLSLERRKFCLTEPPTVHTLRRKQKKKEEEEEESRK
jgi:hypothetical protein